MKDILELRNVRGWTESLHWPNINSDIEQMVGNCDTCQISYRQPKEPMAIGEVPTTAWKKVGVFLFHCNGKDYFLTIVYLSNYPEIALLSSTTAKTVLLYLKSCFAWHGIPLVVVSDNAPQFACSEFEMFAERYEFRHITSSALYPKCNAKTEKGVQIVKRLLKKAISWHMVYELVQKTTLHSTEFFN